jgi:hypothetical protein
MVYKDSWERKRRVQQNEEEYANQTNIKIIGIVRIIW